MAKIIRFVRLELQNFSSLRDLIVNYGDITKLTGANGEGKSTIGGDAPPWIFFGTDSFGRTFNPSPTTYEYDIVRAKITISVDGEEMTFERRIEDGDAVYRIDDSLKTATKFKEAVAGLFDKEDFLTLYNPGFFFSQHKTKQREQVVKYTIRPAKSEVFAEMSRTDPSQKLKDIVLNPAAVKLDELTKKKSLDDLKEDHGGKNGLKTKLEKQYIAAQSRTRTLQEQVDRLPDAPEDLEAVKAESVELLKQIQEIHKQIETAEKSNQKRLAVQSNLTTARQQVDSAKRLYMAVYNEPIEDICPSCNRPLDEDAIKAVTDNKERRKEELRTEHAALVEKRKKLEAEFATLQEISVSELWNQMRDLEQKRDALENAIYAQANRERMQADVDAAKKAEADTLTSLKESIFILDAIKAYLAKEAEIQAEKLKSLFTRLDIRLFKYLKTKEDYEADFSIQMDGKDYITLSTGERIAAGLELTEFFFKQSNLIVPTFIDCFGEYTEDVAVYGQLITAQAVKGKELTIEPINVR